MDPQIDSGLRDNEIMVYIYGGCCLRDDRCDWSKRRTELGMLVDWYGRGWRGPQIYFRSFK